MIPELLAACKTAAERALILRGVVETADVLYSDAGAAVRAIDFERRLAWLVAH